MALRISHSFAGPALPRQVSLVHGNASVLSKGMAARAMRLFQLMLALAKMSGLSVRRNQRARLCSILGMSFEVGLQPMRLYAEIPECAACAKLAHHPLCLLIREWAC